MKHKTESWNGANTDSASSSVRRSLTRAGLQLGQLSHVVSGALGTLQGGASPRGAAQNRMRALLSQDRALLSHRACGQAALEDDLEAPVVPVKGSQTRTAAQNRMRELLNQDRAMLAMREARRRENPASEPIDDDFAAELVQLVDREWTPVQDAPAGVSSVIAEPSVARSPCVGATTSFVAEPEVPSVCTPGPLAPAAAIANATSSAAMSAPALTSPVVSTGVSPAPAAAMRAFAAAPVAPAAVPVPAASPSAGPMAAVPAPVSAPMAAVPAPAAGPMVAVPAPTSAPATAVPARAAAPVVVSKPVVMAPPAAKAPAPSRAADPEEGGVDPIRTRGMAKLLALQGYRDRALSIYDELIAAEPDNAELRAEADRLRN